MPHRSRIMKFLSKTPQIAALSFLALVTSTESRSACVEKAAHTLDVKNDVAIDHTTGLIWRRCAAGTRWNSRMSQCDGEVSGLTQKQALVAARRAGSEWHVPSAAELASLRLNTCEGPKIDTHAFPNVSSSDRGEGMNFWSSTSAISSDTFYYLNFADGSFDFHSGGFNLALLLVRSK